MGHFLTHESLTDVNVSDSQSQTQKMIIDMLRKKKTEKDASKIEVHTTILRHYNLTRTNSDNPYLLVHKISFLFVNLSE